MDRLSSAVTRCICRYPGEFNLNTASTTANVISYPDHQCAPVLRRWTQLSTCSPQGNRTSLNLFTTAQLHRERLEPPVTWRTGPVATREDHYHRSVSPIHSSLLAPLTLTHLDSRNPPCMTDFFVHVSVICRFLWCSLLPLSLLHSPSALWAPFFTSSTFCGCLFPCVCVCV